jgi:PBP1b-binding outer membrane lipoprotein LpoB
MSIRKIIAGILLAIALVLTGCTSAADTANENLSKAAENFEVPRRITAINGITDNVLFTVEGFCSYEVPSNGTFEAICKNPDGTVERTTLYLSDNVTFVSTQMGGAKVDLFRPRVIFRPETIIPNFDLSTSNG